MRDGDEEPPADASTVACTSVWYLDMAVEGGRRGSRRLSNGESHAKFSGASALQSDSRCHRRRLLLRILTTSPTRALHPLHSSGSRHYVAFLEFAPACLHARKNDAPEQRLSKLLLVCSCCSNFQKVSQIEINISQW